MLSTLRRWAWRLGAQPAPIPESLWQSVVAECALLAALSAPQQQRLCALCARFIADKQFVAMPGVQLQPRERLIIAALACLPVLELGYSWLRGWSQIIVYPDEFRVRREHHDDATGVVTEGDDDLIGEAWERGPLVLSWADIEQDLADPHAGFNVVIHEIAHKLDMLQGACDGVPPLPPALSRREWIAAFQHAFDTHVTTVERGIDTRLDPYAAESPDEFFACVSEAWFSCPQQIVEDMPPVAGLLQRFYCPTLNESPRAGVG